MEHPATPFVMTFVGEVNIFHGRAPDGRTLLRPLAAGDAAHAGADVRQTIGYAVARLKTPPPADDGSRARPASSR